MDGFRRLPLSLPATLVVVYLGVLSLLVLWLHLTWPIYYDPSVIQNRVFRDEVEGFRAVATWLNVVNTGWIVLLLVHIAGSFLGRRRDGLRQLPGDVLALVLVSMALVSSLRMHAALPHLGDPGYYSEGVFNLEYDFGAGSWQVVPGE